MNEFELKQEEFRKYILTEDLTKVFPILRYQIILAEPRSELIKESSQKLKKYFMDSVNSSSTEQLFIKLHAQQLDLISKLFMLLEDYLNYSYYLRCNKKDLPEKIISRTMGLHQKEINNIKDLDKAGISEYLLLPHVNKLPLLDKDKKFVEEVLNVLSNESQQSINEIAKFFKNYYRVYIRYKHIFSAFIGLYSVEESKKIPRIFMRDQIEDKKQNVKKYTYILPSNIETLEYYEKLNDHISKMFLLLLACHVQSIQNCGKSFLIADGYFLPTDKKEQWMKIVKKVNFLYGTPPLSLRINVKENIAQKMLQALSENHIYTWDKDILEHKENSLGIGGVRER